MSETEPTSDAFVLTERAAGLAAAIGAVVMASTAAFTIVGTPGQHNVVVGAAIAVVASVLALRTEQGSPSVVLAGVLGLLGLWTAASPFVLEVGWDLVIWLNGAAGGLIAVLSAASVYGVVRPSTTHSSGTAGA